MRRIAVVAASAAVIITLSLFSATSVNARKGGGGFSTAGRSAPRSMQRAPHINRAPTHSVRRRETSTRRALRHERRQKHVGSTKNFSAKAAHKNVEKHVLGKERLRGLPLHKAATGNQFVKGRVAVPRNIRPKLTLTHAPGLKFRPRFAPFVQRHWKKAFFWVAVAGIGYLTVPELYYDRFYSCVSVDDPDYDECSYILSYAALEEEEVVRVSMPAGAKYRYTAKAEVKPASDCPSCRWDSFVERKWNQSYSWVKLPQVGNITVPEAYYDRFYTYAGANPPNYPQACKVLEDAAAAPDEKEAVRVSMPPERELPLQG